MIPPEKAEANRRLRSCAAQKAALDAEIARWIAETHRLDVHLEYGFATFEEYLDDAFGYTPRVAQELKRIATKLQALPLVSAALASGDLNRSKVRELVKVTSPETQVAWVDLARGCSVRTLQKKVRTHKMGDLPTDEPLPDLEPRTLYFEVTPATYALFQEAQRRLAERSGTPIGDDEVVAMMAQAVLCPPSAGEEGMRSPPHQIVVHVCRDCDRARIGDQDLDDAQLAQIRCGAEVIDDTCTPARRTKIPAQVKRTIWAWFEGRCAVPGCRSTRFLEEHHIEHWADGGSHAPSNLVLLCWAHHHAYHHRRLIIRGTSPHWLEFLHGDGSPWRQSAPTASDAVVVVAGDVVAGDVVAGDVAAEARPGTGPDDRASRDAPFVAEEVVAGAVAFDEAEVANDVSSAEQPRQDVC